MKLVELFKTGIYHTDKGYPHHYLELYDELFAPFQDKPINVFEVGYYLGGSCKLWEDYFTKANIRFIDIRKPLTSPRWGVLTLMNSKDLTTEYFKDFPPDIAIDDSTHYLSDQIHFIKVTYPAVRTGGILIVEDVIDLEKYRPSFEVLGIPFEVVDQRKESMQPADVLLIFRK